MKALSKEDDESLAVLHKFIKTPIKVIERTSKLEKTGAKSVQNLSNHVWDIWLIKTNSVF